MALTYTFTSLIPLKPLFPHITNPTKPISLYPKTSTKPHHIAFQAQHNPGPPEELFAEVDILDEGYVPWEGAVVYKRSVRGAHLEFCTTLERLGLGKLESEVSLRRAGVMGLRGGKDRDGTPVMVSVDVGPRKRRKGVRLDGVVRTVITLDCNRCGEPAAEPVFSNFTLILTEEPIKEPETLNLGFILGEDKSNSSAVIGGEEDEDDEASLDLDDILYFPAEEKEIDISKNIRDLVHLEITLNAICDPSCKGLCLGCGTNLNTGTCTCNKQNDKQKSYGPLGKFKEQMLRK